MNREGQPGRIQGLFNRLKRGEMQRRAGQGQTPERVQHPNQTREAPLDQAARERLQQLENSLNQIRRHSLEVGSRPQDVGINLQGWLDFWENSIRQKHFELAPLVPEQQAADKVSTPEKRKDIATKMYKKLNGEVVDIDLAQAALILRKEVWGDDPANPQAKIGRYGDMRIEINSKTGLVKDRSQVGYSLSHGSGNAELYYGLGYFENEENFIPVARGIVSAQDREKGAKAYFIERTQNGITELTVIPFAYAEATTEFLDRLYETALDLVPDEIRHRRHAPQQLAA